MSRQTSNTITVGRYSVMEMVKSGFDGAEEQKYWIVIGPGANAGYVHNTLDGAISKAEELERERGDKDERGIGGR